jgi:RNA polymerase sigma-70 factor, ECF subfamily
MAARHNPGAIFSWLTCERDLHRQDAKNAKVLRQFASKNGVLLQANRVRCQQTSFSIICGAHVLRICKAQAAFSWRLGGENRFSLFHQPQSHPAEQGCVFACGSVCHSGFWLLDSVNLHSTHYFRCTVKRATGRKQVRGGIMGVSQDVLVRVLLVHRAKLIGYIASIMCDPHLAEDVFQNVAVIALRKAETIADAGCFPGWLFKTARFEALNAMRKQRKQPQPLDEEVLDLLDSAWQIETADTDNELALNALRDCCSRLTARSRRLVELRYAENVSGKGLAESLGQPVNTVYVALSRIHKALRECVARKMLKGATVF